jgi:hypothetical protein
MIEWRIWQRGAKSQQVKFVHHSATANIGDILTSPRHYFHFKSNVGTLAIVGGGAFAELAVPYASQEAADAYVLWAVGRSSRPEVAEKEIDYGLALRFYKACSTRDPEDAIRGVELVPCASVLHSICDLPVGDSTGLILNGHPDVSGQDLQDTIIRYSQRDGLIVTTNELKEAEYLRAFSQMKCIVTNSYHAAYWALLSRRTVALLGYSSKFVSLYRLFGLDPTNIVTYRRDGGADFERALTETFRDPPYVQLSNAAKTKQHFREINLNFAQSLAAEGIVAIEKTRSRASST